MKGRQFIEKFGFEHFEHFSNGNYEETCLSFTNDGKEGIYEIISNGSVVRADIIDLDRDIKHQIPKYLYERFLGEE